MTYRYPVPKGQERKGIVFYVHGFGAYSEHTAFMFKTLAETRGYEVISMDQRGFGNSGGQRGLFESQSVIYGDLYLMVFRAIQQYKINLQEVPLFLYGKSFGGLMSFNLSLRYPQLFSGLALLVPFFQHYTDTIDKYQYVLKFCNIFQLYYSFGMRDYPDKYKYLNNDPKYVHHAKISSLVMFHDEQ
jgi:alpha-beta hydrolase superfamily lysophospholipase